MMHPILEYPRMGYGNRTLLSESSRGRTMKAIATAVVLCFLLTLLGCNPSSSSPCSQYLLAQFQGSKEAKFSYSTIRALLQSGASKDYGWTIARQGDGCSVFYKAAVNGREYEWYHWYIDPETRTVHPDDNDAEVLVQIGGLAPTVLSK
jgi:hypothetical protein